MVLVDSVRPAYGLLLATGMVLASSAAVRGATISPLGAATVDVLQSAILDGERSFSIALPVDFAEDADDQRYPVVVVSEPEFFPLVVAAVRHLASMERIPASIVVGLEDGVEVPPLWTNGSRFWPADWETLRFGVDPAPFVAHLERELFPYLAERYRAAPFRTLVGFSGSAAFTLHTVCAAPDLFQAHVALAAGDLLQMGHERGTTLVDEMGACLAAAPERAFRLFVASADADVDLEPAIPRNLEALRARLAPLAGPERRIASRLFANEGHYDVVLPALSEAFELVFPRERWSPRYREWLEPPGTLLERMDAHYAARSRELGFPVRARAERWNSINSLRWLGRELLRRERPGEAVEVYARRVAARPRSLAARIDLAEGLVALAETARAVAVLEAASELATPGSAERDALDVRLSELRSLADATP